MQNYSNWPIKETNNKIKALKRTTFGMHNLKNFKARINIHQLSWWFFKYAHSASLPATSKDVPFLTDSCFFYLLTLKWVYIFYCQLITQSVFFQLICYVFFYLFCIFSYCINIISSTPKFSISIFIFHISPLAIYYYATFSF